MEGWSDGRALAIHSTTSERVRVGAPPLRVT